jgi:Mrp family chromosome partitioning ATPase
MEKIKKALDQAREKRGTNKDIVTNDQSILNNESNHKLGRFDADRTYITYETSDTSLEDKRILNQSSKEEVVHPYKILRTRLTQIMRENNWSSVAMVSPSQDDGKTTVGINLAICIARGHQSTSILLDLDLMSPSVHSTLSYNPEISLNDYFEKDLMLHELLVCPGIEGFAFAPTAKPIKRSSEFLTSEKGTKLISEARKLDHKAIIIVDIPPLLCSDDAIAYLPNVDCVVLVIREGKTKKEDIQRSMELLAGQNIAGIILNDSVQSAEYGYYDYSSS